MCFYILHKYSSEDFHAKGQISLSSNPICNINSGGTFLKETSSYSTVHSTVHSTGTLRIHVTLFFKPSHNFKGQAPTKMT